MFQVTTATKKIAALKKRIKAVQGGTSASKTISILLVLIDLAQRDEKPTVTSIVSESFPHLKRGAMRDFLQIMEEHRYFEPKRWNRSDYIYTFEGGSVIEFFSADQPGKVRGPRRHRLFINEANNVPRETFDQLEVRTRDSIFLDWNPTVEFWFYEDDIRQRDDVDFLVLTYKDNEALAPSIVAAIEKRKTNRMWWQVYGEGQLGEIDSMIYRGWKIIDEIPHEARLERRWLDFGYTNDPTSIGDIYYYNGGYILDELTYTKGLSNKKIADVLLAQAERDIIAVADSAEPKSIDEIKSYDVIVVPSQKGPGSVLRGIQYVQGQKISVTKRSVNTIREYRRYVWLTDRDGKIVNEEDPACENHSMAGIRYALANLDPGFGQEEEKEKRKRSQEFRSGILDGGEVNTNPFHTED